MSSAPTKSWLPGFIALAVTWGASFLFMKYGLQSLHPLGVAFGRGFIGALTLVTYGVITRSGFPREWRHWRIFALLAVMQNAVPAYLFASAETHISSVMAGLLNATTPLMTIMAISFGFREQKVTANQILGVFLGFGGIVLVSGVLAAQVQVNWWGYGSILLAALLYGVSFPIARRHFATWNYSATTIAAAQVSCSVLMLAPFVILDPPLRPHLYWSSLCAMLGLGALGTGFAYIWNIRNVQLAGPAVASTVTYLAPVIATILGVVVLHERLVWSQYLGGVLVIVSAMTVQGRLRIIPARAAVPSA